MEVDLSKRMAWRFIQAVQPRDADYRFNFTDVKGVNQSFFIRDKYLINTLLALTNAEPKHRVTKVFVEVADSFIVGIEVQK